MLTGLGCFVLCADRGMDVFRHLQRLANPQGLTLFSVIIEQHAAILDWLSELPFVDPQRIGFYGLSCASPGPITTLGAC